MDLICKHLPHELVAEATKTQSQEEEIILCADCNYHVTDPSNQIMVMDSFHHVFANPHGVVFEIGCFAKARGCRASSTPSTEFSWFSGFSWQIGVCRYCSGHLGWVFSLDTQRFYGLIIEKLIFP